MRPTFEETQERLFCLREGEIAHIQSYEEYSEKHRNDNKFDYVSDVYVPLSFLQDRTLNVHTHDRFSTPNYHTHKFIEITFILEGEFINTVEGHEMIMRKGDVCLLPPDIYHSFDIISKDPDARTKSFAMNIFVRADSAKSYFSSCGNDSLEKYINNVCAKNNHRKFAFFSCRDRSIAEWLIRLLHYETKYNKQEGRKAFEKVAAALFTAFIAELCSDSYSVSYSNSFTNNSETGDILKYISDNCKTVSLEKVASHFNYSFSYASKLIKQRTGLGFSALISGIKIDKACELLSGSDMSIRDIANECGYGSIEHFHRTFKKAKGMTPAQYKEKNK